MWMGTEEILEEFDRGWCKGTWWSKCTQWVTDTEEDEADKQREQEQETNKEQCIVTMEDED